jgi:hypothetical protein
MKVCAARESTTYFHRLYNGFASHGPFKTQELHQQNLPNRPPLEVTPSMRGLIPQYHYIYIHDFRSLDNFPPSFQNNLHQP